MRAAAAAVDTPRMEAHARDLQFLAAEQIVRIPFFQRPYVWKEENWDALLEDLADSERTHFLGSLILKQVGVTSGEPRVVLVIDGQQRLTTLGILLKALYDGLPPELRTNALSAIRTLLFFQKSPLDPGWVVKLEHSRVDREAYETIIRSGIDTPEADLEEEPSSRIERCYRHFRRKLGDRSESERRALFTRLLDQQNKMLVVIDLHVRDDEQAIFDTINSAGVRLTAADIVKNALFQRAIEVLGRDAAVRLYETSWSKTFLEDDETVEYWSTERKTGRLMRDNIEILLHAVAVIAGLYDPEKHSLSQLAALYKAEIAKLATADAVTSFVAQITRYAALYREHLEPLDGALEDGDHLERLLHVLEVFDVSTFLPFVLFALGREDDDERARLLRQLERLVVRRAVAGHETRSYNRLTRELVQRPEALAELLQKTSDQEVAKGLRGIDNKTAAVLLFWVELRRRSNDRNFDEKALVFRYTLEHVMPQKWEAHWALPLKTKADGTLMSPEEAKRDRTEKVYWLGNMTLLTGSLNSSLKNKPFDRKVSGEGRMRGMKRYASLSITQDVVAETSWDEGKIEARTAALEKEILAIWSASDA